MQPDDSTKPVVVREPDASKDARPVLRGGSSREARSLPSPVEPIQVLQAARATTAAPPRLPEVILAGATGALGGEVLRRLVGGERQGTVHVVAREPVRDGLRGVQTLLASSDDPNAWPHRHAQIGVILFDPPRLYHDRERALHTPSPDNWIAVAEWMRRCGVETLAIAMPHVQAQLPRSLQEGLASLDEHAAVALDFRRVILVRSAQKPRTPEPASWPSRVALQVLAALQYMVPPSEQPVRARRVAEFLDAALQYAPDGIHVASPGLVWQAAQGDVQTTVRQWLTAGG
jgi:hypothetical protein